MQQVYLPKIFMLYVLLLLYGGKEILQQVPTLGKVQANKVSAGSLKNSTPSFLMMPGTTADSIMRFISRKNASKRNINSSKWLRSSLEASLQDRNLAASPVLGDKGYIEQFLRPLTEENSVPEVKKITLLGSTGSIGRQAVEILEMFPNQFELVGLAAGSNVDSLARQARHLKPKIVGIADKSKAHLLVAALEGMGSDKPIVVSGEEGMAHVASFGDADVVVTGIVGCAGLLPTVKAIEAGKKIALANKETLVAAGPVILPLLKKHGSYVIPADSEHSAIFQCIQGHTRSSIRSVILTASGGAFRNWSAEEMKHITPEDALTHPNWSMGAKITIDSATLMNKGLEVIEAHYLFGTSLDDIKVLVHPQSIIHSMVEFEDTSILAQLGWPDMRLPLLHSMSWPGKLRAPLESLDLLKIGNLTFQAPDLERFPCLSLAYKAGHEKGTMPAVLNAANEQAVSMFREKKISFSEIPSICEKVMEEHKPYHKVDNITLEDIVSADEFARSRAKEWKKKFMFA